MRYLPQAVTLDHVEGWMDGLDGAYGDRKTKVQATNSSVTKGDFLLDGRELFFNGAAHLTLGTTPNIKTFLAWIEPASMTKPIISATEGEVTLTAGTLSSTGFTSPTYYVNGVSGTTTTVAVWQLIAVTTNTAFTMTTPLLGKKGSTFFEGSMANILFFNIALTTRQIRWVYDTWGKGFQTIPQETDFMLLETGEFVLQETGDKIVL